MTTNFTKIKMKTEAIKIKSDLKYEQNSIANNTNLFIQFVIFLYNSN